MDLTNPMHIATKSSKIDITLEKDTKSISQKISNYLSKGDIVFLYGEMGVGKTTFIKGILKGLGYKGDVSSPTYTLVNEYDSKYKVIHIDCYREENIDRWLDVGIIDYLNSNNIVIIEWAEYINDILPNNIINININHISEFSRKVEFLL